MKNKLLVLIALMFTFFVNQAQNFKVLLVDDDNNTVEIATVDTAVRHAGYPYLAVAAYTAVPSFAQMEQYDMVIWHTGNDATINLWKADANENSVYNDALKQFANNGGIVWVDGLDFLFDVVDAAPDVFPDGSFIKDTLGISDYLSQSHTAADGNLGVSQYDISAGNMVTSLDPITWTYSTLWSADGLAITANAHALYEMGPAGYALADQITALYNQVGTGTYITSGIRIGKINNQTNTDLLISSLLTYSANNWDTEFNSVAPGSAQTLTVGSDGTILSVTESVGWDSREWKYSTTSGSGYVSFATTQIGTTYTPNFSSVGTYYVVCQTTYGSTIVTSNEVQINVEDIPIDISVGSISGSPFYVSATNTANIDVPYTIIGTFNAGNIFTAYLSDATGVFTNEVAIGTYSSTTNGTISAQIPAGTTSGTGYRIRIKSSDPAFTSADNGSNLEIVNVTNSVSPTATQTISVGENGTQLTVSETPTATSREWKYSTTSGSGYVSFSPAQTGTTYTPSFDVAGTYYLVCESSYNSGSVSAISNEVQINVQTAFKVLLVDDDNNTVEIAPVDAALTNSSYSYFKITTTDSIPSLATLQQYDMVLWYTGNDGTTNLWDADSTYINQLETYVNNGGLLWVDGLDIIYNIYGSAPDDFYPGDFIYDKLGISQFLSQSYANDGNIGVAQMDITPENKITTLNPVTWVYSTLWYADGLNLTEKAVPLYAFGGAGYALAGQVNSLYKQENFGTYLTTGLRIAKINNQTNLDQIVLDVINYAQETPAVYCENLDETTYYVSATNGTNIEIPYSIDGGFDFNSNNVFTAYLSDATGDFTNEIAIGTLNFTAGDTITATIPAGTSPGTAYRVRVKATNPNLTSNDNGIDFTIVLASVEITPDTEQTIYVNQNGTQLTVSETPAATSREWKYSTTSGSGYVSFATPETGTTYTPNFNAAYTYYVVCESTISSSLVTSNEVVVNVLSFEIATGTITGSPFVVTSTTGASVDVPYTITGFFNTGNIFTAYLSDATGDFTNEVAIGTYASTTDGTITAQIPAATASGTAYRIRVKSDNPVVVGTDNGTNIVIDLNTYIASQNSENFKLYPNPVSDFLNIDIENIQKYEISIFDNNGKLVKAGKNSNGKINVSDLPQGTYTLQLRNTEQNLTSVFIKL